MAMRFLNRYLFIGIGVGVVLTLAVFFGVGFIAYKTMLTPEKMEAMLQPPHFPDPSKASVLGQADLTWGFHGLDGSEVTLSDFRGKVVFLNFWATWCGPCVTEMPSIERLYDSLKGERVAFVLVSNENKDKVHRFMEKKQLHLPAYVRGEDLPDVFRRGSVPVTFILSPTGAIVFEHPGSARWDGEACRSFIRGLLR
jgi:thiol-disulfide isomerase/thioredoxin